MENFQSVLGRAAGNALCKVLEDYGSAAPLLTAFSLIEPTPFVEVAAVTSGLAALAAQSGCNWNTQGEGPPAAPSYTGCQKVETGFARMKGNRPNDPVDADYFAYTEIKAFYTVFSGGTEFEQFDYISLDGEEKSIRVDAVVVGTQYFSELSPDGVCEEPAPGPEEPIPDPIDYTDAETGCSLTVNFKGWGINQVGAASGVWEIAPAAEQLRASGGVIGGCNFNPVIYVDDGSGGGGGGFGPPGLPYAPVPPGDPLSPDLLAELAREILAGTVGAAIASQLNALFEEPYAGTVYRLVSVCETDAGGEPISQSVTEVIPALNSTEAILSRLDALVPLLQGQKDFKQPVCRPEKPAGDIRTISFRSEEVSPAGKSCLRKRLRYRSISGIGLDGLIDHWKDFSFQAGPVLVRNVGSTLGTIKCWANSVDEGKRVLLHAFAEAGVDANQTGRWEISGSTSTRLGMPGTMNVDITGGYYWITARDGSDNRPIVGKT
jgi:hypothetical protein